MCAFFLFLSLYSKIKFGGGDGTTWPLNVISIKRRGAYIIVLLSSHAGLSHSIYHYTYAHDTISYYIRASVLLHLYTRLRAHEIYIYIYILSIETLVHCAHKRDTVGPIYVYNKRGGWNNIILYTLRGVSVNDGSYSVLSVATDRNGTFGASGCIFL